MLPSFYKYKKKVIKYVHFEIIPIPKENLGKKKEEEKLRMYIYTIFNRLIFFKVNSNMIHPYFWVGVRVRRMSGRTAVTLYSLIHVCSIISSTVKNYRKYRA